MTKEEVEEKFPSRQQEAKKLRTGKRSLSHFDLIDPAATTNYNETRQSRRRRQFKLKKKYRKILNEKSSVNG